MYLNTFFRTKDITFVTYLRKTQLRSSADFIVLIMAAAMFTCPQWKKYNKNLTAKKSTSTKRKRNDGEDNNSNKKMKYNSCDSDSSEKSFIEECAQLLENQLSQNCEDIPTCSTSTVPPVEQSSQSQDEKHSSSSESNSSSDSSSEPTACQNKKFSKRVATKTTSKGKTMSKDDMKKLDIDIMKLNDVDMCQLLHLIQEREPEVADGDVEMNFENFKYMTLKVMKTFIASRLLRHSRPKRQYRQKGQKYCEPLVDNSSTESDSD